MSARGTLRLPIPDQNTALGDFRDNPFASCPFEDALHTALSFVCIDATCDQVPVRSVLDSSAVSKRYSNMHAVPSVCKIEHPRHIDLPRSRKKWVRMGPFS